MAGLGRTARHAVALTCLLATTAACGARWTDAQAERIAARDKQTATTRAGDPGDTTGADVAADPGAASSDVVGGVGGAATGGPSGGASSARSSGSTASGPRACAAPSNAPGVTTDKLTIGSISTLSGPSPGIGASSAAAVRSYVAFRNATGGVCGRQVVLKEGDDGFDSARYRTVLNEMAPQVLGLAGGFAGGDIGATDLIRDKNIPVVGIPSSDNVTALPSVFDMNPPYKSLDVAIGKYKYLKANGASKVSAVYLAVEQSRAEAQLQMRLMRAAGLQIVQVQELPLSTLSYDSSARGVANSGADYLFFIGTADSNVSMARSMKDTGYKLDFAEYLVFSYGTNFIEQAGRDAAEGAVTWIRTLPTEEAASNRELATYIEWMERTAPGEPRDAFAADSWVGAKAFFDSLTNLTGPITRENLIARLKATPSFDADGFMGAILLGEEHTNGCYVAMRVIGGAWKRLTPATGFLC